MGRNLARFSVGASAVAALLSSCTGPFQTTATANLVSYDIPGALFDNGFLPTPTPQTACGSSTATYLAELQNTNPLYAKVPMHWGDIVPGKDMMIQGTVVNPDVGALDLPFDHPFGGDASMDVNLDSPFLGLGGSYGANGRNADQPATVTHIEIESGLLPHVAAQPGPASGQAWQDAANADTAGIMPGFTPQSGDRLLALGRWIIDCGHSDFHTEIHPINFFADARTSGSTTQVFTFYNPYHDSQLYNPDSSIASNVADNSRLTQSATQPFPAYMVSEILRLAHIGDPGSSAGYPSTFPSASLEEANTDSPVTWYACAPPGVHSGSHLHVNYDLAARPGVWVAVVPNDAAGCASIATVMTGAYVPQDPAQRQCVLPWAWLNQQAASEVGSSSLNIQQLIQSDLPSSLQSNTFLQQALQQNPVTSCYDPLSAPVPDPVGTNEQVEKVTAAEPFPFYGWITVAWGS